MVDPFRLSFDIASVAVSTALPGLVWAALFALAWRQPAFAESLGLGRRVFWLLLPGGLLASFALLPLAAIGPDVVAVSFAGAVFPLAVGTLALERIASPFRGSAGTLFATLAVETAGLLAVVLLADAGRLSAVADALGTTGGAAELLLVAVGGVAATAVGSVLLYRPGDRSPGGLATVFGLTSGVLVLTFVGARAIPGVGITESFPYFLVPPTVAGIGAVLLAPRAFPTTRAAALPAAFFATGWGVVLGADVLWQPPLYGGGQGGLYAIGGAGVLDLVYLSAGLGLLAAWGTHRLLGREGEPMGPPLPAEPPSPTGRLREAFVRGVEGSTAASISASAQAARAAALQTRRLLDVSPAAGSRPWDGLAVPGWVVSDQANLESVARAGIADPREALRAWLTARALVRLGERLSRPKFASIPQRLVAFAVDAALLGGGAAAVFVAVVLVTPGGVSADLGSVALNTAIYAFVALSLLYFALSELWAGATLGKRWVGIEVRDRALNRPGGLAAFLRNAPLLPVMTLVALGLALTVVIGLRGLSSAASVGGIGVSAGALALLSVGAFVLGGVALAGAVGVATIVVSAERQRVGDLWAGTWVVRRSTRAGPGAPTAPGPPPFG